MRKSTPELADPIVDEVTLEKTEVCEGEENLISVRAHSPDGDDRFLHYSVGNGRGQEVPLRAFLNSHGEAPEQTLIVYGKGDRHTMAKVPRYAVMKCNNQSFLIVTLRAPPNTVDTYEVWARLVQQPPAKPFLPNSYEWSFGDGQSATTSAPVVEHTYRTSPQVKAYSQFLVSVAAISATGERILGRYSFERRNYAFAEKERGYVALFVESSPRFPELTGERTIKQRLRIWHYEETPVRLTRLQHYGLYENSGDDPVTPPRIDETDLPGLLGQVEVPPGEGIEQTVEVSFRENGLYGVNFVLEGLGSGGAIARGGFSLMKPPPKPNRENSIEVSDPALVAKIRKALEILGKDTVSQEEISRLEREGRLSRGGDAER